MPGRSPALQVPGARCAAKHDYDAVLETWRTLDAQLR